MHAQSLLGEHSAHAHLTADRVGIGWLGPPHQIAIPGTGRHRLMVVEEHEAFDIVDFFSFVKRAKWCMHARGGSQLVESGPGNSFLVAEPAARYWVLVGFE